MGTVPEYPELIDSAEVAAFVGPKADVYTEKWRAMWNARPNPKTVESALSWNWAAFFLGGFWMCYRKMWVLGGSVLLLMISLELFLLPALPIPPLTMAIIFSVTLGMLGNAIYLAHVRKGLTRIAASEKDSAARESALAKAGGVSWPGGLGAIVLSLVAGAALGVMLEVVSPHTTRLAAVEGPWETLDGQIIVYDLAALTPTIEKNGVKLNVLEPQVNNDSNTIVYSFKDTDGQTHTETLHITWLVQNELFMLSLDNGDGSPMPLSYVGEDTAL